MGKSKQPYYDSNWELYKKAPDDFFVPHSFDEIMEWKVAGWELPASVCCVIRVGWRELCGWSWREGMMWMELEGGDEEEGAGGVDMLKEKQEPHI